MKNVFQPETVKGLENRIHNLSIESKPQWGKMNVAQMLAHCNVTYEMVYTTKHPKPKGIMKWVLKTFVKSAVVNEKPYSKNGKTAPAFKIVDQREFETEKERLLGYLTQTQELGESHFDGKESHSFGTLTAKEWNNLFYKHLDHHLRQFDV